MRLVGVFAAVLSAIGCVLGIVLSACEFFAATANGACDSARPKSGDSGKLLPNILNRGLSNFFKKDNLPNALNY